MRSNYEEFNLNDYVENPVALIRIKAHLTQEELANYLNVSQAYISKIENQTKVSLNVLDKIKRVLKNNNLF